MSGFKCEFKLEGRGRMPVCQSDFHRALNVPFTHYTANTFDVSVVSNHFTVIAANATPEELFHDIHKVAQRYNKQVVDLKIQPY